jgi:hypothetical protein
VCITRHHGCSKKRRSGGSIKERGNLGDKAAVKS